MDKQVEQPVAAPFHASTKPDEAPLFDTLARRVRKLQDRGRELLPFKIQLADGRVRGFGNGEPVIQYAIDACGAKPGDRVLDIGGGWGSLLQYGGERGLRITSLTISEESARYMRKVVAEKGLPCEVVKEHLLAYRNPEPFDAIINLGVTEHLPDYPRTIEQYTRLLKPGHKMYLDAYSGKRYGMSAFVSKWVFQGNTSPWCLHEYFEELAHTEFEVLLLQNDRHNYFLSCKKWAENLEAAKDVVTARWGEFLYRRFRLYLLASLGRSRTACSTPTAWCCGCRPISSAGGCGWGRAS